MKSYFLAAALLAWIAPATAVEFKTVLPESSRLGFTYKQMGVTMQGRIKKFTASIAFDPANPATAKATIELDMSQVDVGYAEGNSEVAGKQWFSVKEFPKAVFAASQIKSLGGNRYEVGGTLSMKGRSVPVSAPATLVMQGDKALIEGVLSIRRGDFSIGEGAWAAFDTVANEIQITFKLLATAGK